MRIAVLCNDRIALPALDYLINTGLAVAVGMPERASETQLIVQGKCKQANLSFHVFNKKNFAECLTAWLDQYQPDVVLVKTFPFLIPASALKTPKHGFINFHYAPLPAWRGANPLFWMLRQGEKQGGVTIHEMTAAYDEGPIIAEQPVSIGHNVNFGILYTQLAHAGFQLTVQLINNIYTDRIQRKPQDHSKAKWYSHPKPSDLFIDWQTMRAEEIINLVRACNPLYKGAAARWKGWPFGITYASVLNHPVIGVSAGSILSIDINAGFTVATKDGKAILAEVVYCEEGFYPGYCMSAFGVQKNDQLT